MIDQTREKKTNEEDGVVISQFRGASDSKRQYATIAGKMAAKNVKIKVHTNDQIK